MTGPPAAAGAPGPRSGDVAVVVVNYESGAALRACLESVRHQAPGEVVVVDNGSSDGSLDAVRSDMPEVVVVEPGRNLGYGTAANRGVAATTAPYVVVSNADVEFRPGVLDALAEVLEEDGGRALVGPLLRTPRGDRYPSARRFPSLLDAAGHALLGIVAPGNRFTRAYQRSDLDAGGAAPSDVDWVSGACFAVRRAAFDEVGGFDESYFMYAEDVDLCWRLGRRGWRVVYAPAAEVVHVQGTSTDRRPYRMIVEHHRSLWRFARRSEEGWRRAFLPAVAAGLAVRTGLALLDRLLTGTAGRREGRTSGSRVSTRHAAPGE